MHQNRTRTVSFSYSFVQITSVFSFTACSSCHKDPLWGNPLLPSTLTWLPFAKARGVTLSVTYGSRSDRDKEAHYECSCRIWTLLKLLLDVLVSGPLQELVGFQSFYFVISHLSHLWPPLNTTKLFLSLPSFCVDESNLVRVGLLKFSLNGHFSS